MEGSDTYLEGLERKYYLKSVSRVNLYLVHERKKSPFVEVEFRTMAIEYACA